MSNFTPSVFYTTEFEGDSVSMTITRLKRKTIMKLIPLFTDVDLEDFKKGRDEINADAMVKVLDVVSDELPKYVHDFTGLTDSEGKQLKFKDIVDEMYFLSLVIDIFSKMMEMSSIGDPKKLAALSEK